MTVRFGNYASTTLTADITAAATTINVADLVGFPTVAVAGEYYYLTLVDAASVGVVQVNPVQREIVRVTGAAGNVLTVVRGLDGTTAQAFSTGSYAELRFNALAANDMAPQEGVWTPTWVGTTGNPVVTYAVQSGFYTKIGRLVLINANLRITAFAAGGGVLRIGGLPFTCGSSQGHRAGCAVDYCSNFPAATAPSSMLAEAATTELGLFRRASADVRDVLNASLSAVTGLTAATDIYISGSYIAV